MFDIFKKQFIEVIEWTEEENGVLAYRFPTLDKEIQSGAQLTVRESQVALFVNEGNIADSFTPGRYKRDLHQKIAANQARGTLHLQKWPGGY